jgi:predicted metal-dependent HD superfamily phosphohydrolase
MLDILITKALEECRTLPIVASAFDRLRRELPHSLTYHAYAHSEDVFEETIRFAVIGGLHPREVELLAVAAAFHDAGFISTPKENEPLAAELALSEMGTSGGYRSNECALVKQMILDTALKKAQDGLRQHATTPLSGYLLDADLSNLGRDDFFEKGELQRRENDSDEATFWIAALSLIKSHRWNTPGARAMRARKQLRNIDILEQRIRKGES